MSKKRNPCGHCGHDDPILDYANVKPGFAICRQCRDDYCVTPESPQMKYDKAFYVTGAIYRMLRTKRIDRECAKTLLQSRAKMKADLAKGVVEMWFTSWPIRQAYELVEG